MPAKPKKIEAETGETELDISELADSLDALLKSYSDDAQDGLEEAQKNAQRLLKKARSSLKENLPDTDDVAAPSCCADAWVRDNPLPAAGIGAALGLIAGFLLAKR